MDSGGNEYGQCGEEPEHKDDTGRPLRRDIVIPQSCAPKLVVRQVAYVCQCHAVLEPKMICLWFCSRFNVYLCTFLYLIIDFYVTIISM